MTRRDLLFLQAAQEYPSVSIIVELAKDMTNRKNNDTKIKNAIAEVKKRLLQEFPEQDIKPIIDNLHALAGSIDYEHTTAQSLAFFANKDVREVYYLPVRLTDRVMVNASFEVRDIIWALNRLPRYWVLALSKKPSRFFYGVGDTLSEVIEPVQNPAGVDQDGFPYSYLAPNDKTEFDQTGNQLHNFPKYDDERTRKFYERVWHLAQRFVKPDPVPVLIAADNKNHSFFKEVSHNYPEAGWIEGDYAKKSVHDLAADAWPVMKKYLQSLQQAKIKEFEEDAMGSKKHAFGIEEVWRAAQEGRVKDLLVEEHFTVQGLADPDNKFHVLLAKKGQELPHITDVVNELVEVVLSKGEATVTFVEPGALKKYGQVAAILRY